MPTVNTVLGAVETADLGFTLSHEHVGTNAAGLRHTYPEFLSRRVLPRLKELGASDHDIHQITVENPRRFFEGG